MLIFVDLGFLCCLTPLTTMISLNPVAFLRPAPIAKVQAASPVARREIVPSPPPGTRLPSSSWAYGEPVGGVDDPDLSIDHAVTPGDQSGIVEQAVPAPKAAPIAMPSIARSNT